MFRRIRWQILVALTGSLIVLLLFGVLAASTATSRLFFDKAYVEGVVGVPKQLNPLLQSSDGPTSEEDLTALLFAGLTRSGPDGSPQPDLAERWTIDDSGKVYTFTLRSGLRWHDGVELTADDVVFTIDNVQSSKFRGDPVLSEIWRTALVDRVDRRRVRFTLPAPFAPFLATTNLPILPAHLLKGLSPDRWAGAAFSAAPVGAGPFRLRALDETQAMLVPFEGAARGRPALDLLILRFFPSADAAHAALRRHDIQGVASVAVPGMQPAETSGNFQKVALPLGEFTILTFNLRGPLLADQSLRTALSRGLDRNELIRRVLDGQAQVLDTPVLPQTWAHGDATLPRPDRAAAEAALDALGWRRGADGIRTRRGQHLSLPLVCSRSAGQHALAREIARQWSTLGIDVPIEALSLDDLLSRVKKRNFTLLINTWTATGADPDPFALWHSSQARNGANYAGLADQTSDTLLANGRTTPDQEERARIYKAWERRWVGLVPSLPLYQPRLVYELEQDIHPAGLDQTHLLETPTARFDSIGSWTVALPR